MNPPQLVVIGNPENRRVEFFCDAAARLGFPRPRVLAYEAILAGEVEIVPSVPVGSLVRIESPGENAAVERRFIAAGALSSGQPPDVVDGLREVVVDHGRIHQPQFWYAGFSDWLSRVEQQLAAKNVTWMNHPSDIGLMFDKLRCQQQLSENKLPVPGLLGEITSYAQLRQKMRERGVTRVFVKLLHGSSASGVVAFQTSGTRVLAVTSVELVEAGADVELYNSLKMRRYERETQACQLIDAVCRHGAYAEVWLPKAGWRGKTFDLRVVVINGQVRHVVMRTSRGPVTNLHLGNARGDVRELLANLPSGTKERAWETCRQVARVFPRSLYLGIDLLFSPRFDKHAILEVNAFGDLLPNVLSDGMDTYAAELHAVEDALPGRR